MEGCWQKAREEDDVQPTCCCWTVSYLIIAQTKTPTHIFNIHTETARIGSMCVCEHGSLDLKNSLTYMVALLYES